MHHYQIIESNKEVIQLLRQISEKLDIIVTELQPKEVTVSSTVNVVNPEMVANYIKGNKDLLHNILRFDTNEKRPKTLQMPLTAFKFDNPALDSNNLSNEQIQDLSRYVNRAIDNGNFTIRIPW